MHLSTKSTKISAQAPVQHDEASPFAKNIISLECNNSSCDRATLSRWFATVSSLLTASDVEISSALLSRPYLALVVRPSRIAVGLKLDATFACSDGLERLRVDADAVNVPVVIGTQLWYMCQELDVGSVIDAESFRLWRIKLTDSFSVPCPTCSFERYPPLGCFIVSSKLTRLPVFAFVDPRKLHFNRGARSLKMYLHNESLTVPVSLQQLSDTVRSWCDNFSNYSLYTPTCVFMRLVKDAVRGIFEPLRAAKISFRIQQEIERGEEAAERDAIFAGKSSEHHPDLRVFCISTDVERSQNGPKENNGHNTEYARGIFAREDNAPCVVRADMTQFRSGFRALVAAQCTREQLPLAQMRARFMSRCVELAAYIAAGNVTSAVSKNTRFKTTDMGGQTHESDICGIAQRDHAMAKNECESRRGYYRASTRYLLTAPNQPAQLLYAPVHATKLVSGQVLTNSHQSLHTSSLNYVCALNTVDSKNAGMHLELLPGTHLVHKFQCLSDDETVESLQQAAAWLQHEFPLVQRENCLCSQPSPLPRKVLLGLELVRAAASASQVLDCRCPRFPHTSTHVENLTEDESEQKAEESNFTQDPAVELEFLRQVTEASNDAPAPETVLTWNDRDDNAQKVTLVDSCMREHHFESCDLPRLDLVVLAAIYGEHMPAQNGVIPLDVFYSREKRVGLFRSAPNCLLDERLLLSPTTREWLLVEYASAWAPLLSPRVDGNTSLLGTVASIVSLPGHSATAKTAAGLSGLRHASGLPIPPELNFQRCGNFAKRDTLHLSQPTKSLCYPQSDMARRESVALPTQLAYVVVTALGGDNVEDGIVVSKSARDRGFGMTESTWSVTLKAVMVNPNNGVKLCLPTRTGLFRHTELPTDFQTCDIDLEEWYRRRLVQEGTALLDIGGVTRVSSFSTNVEIMTVQSSTRVLFADPYACGGRDGRLQVYRVCLARKLSKDRNRAGLNQSKQSKRTEKRKLAAQHKVLLNSGVDHAKQSTKETVPKRTNLQKKKQPTESATAEVIPEDENSPKPKLCKRKPVFSTDQQRAQSPNETCSNLEQGSTPSSQCTLKFGDEVTISLFFREQRLLECGDKYSTVDGQKSTVVSVVPTEDLPFFGRGDVRLPPQADVYCNLSMEKRQTLGMTIAANIRAMKAARPDETDLAVLTGDESIHQRDIRSAICSVNCSATQSVTGKPQNSFERHCCVNKTSRIRAHIKKCSRETAKATGNHNSVPSSSSAFAAGTNLPHSAGGNVGQNFSESFEATILEKKVTQSNSKELARDANVAAPKELCNKHCVAALNKHSARQQECPCVQSEQQFKQSKAELCVNVKQWDRKIEQVETNLLPDPNDIDPVCRLLQQAVDMRQHSVFDGRTGLFMGLGDLLVVPFVRYEQEGSKAAHYTAESEDILRSLLGDYPERGRGSLGGMKQSQSDTCNLQAAGAVPRHTEQLQRQAEPCLAIDRQSGRVPQSTTDFFRTLNILGFDVSLQ